MTPDTPSQGDLELQKLLIFADPEPRYQTKEKAQAETARIVQAEVRS